MPEGDSDDTSYGKLDFGEPLHYSLSSWQKPRLVFRKNKHLFSLMYRLFV